MDTFKFEMYQTNVPETSAVLSVKTQEVKTEETRPEDGVPAS